VVWLGSNWGKTEKIKYQRAAANNYVFVRCVRISLAIEAWPLWLVVDAAYTYQYFKGQLYLTGVLYVIFSVVAVWGWIRWNRESKKYIYD